MFDYKFIEYIALVFLLIKPLHAYSIEDPQKTKVDTILAKAATEANEELAGTKVDEYTRIRLIGFDKNIPIYIYLYSTSIDSKPLSAEQIKSMDLFHINKTCGSKFRPLMKNPYDLKVSHEFENMRTGKTIYKIVIGNKECLAPSRAAPATQSTSTLTNTDKIEIPSPLSLYEDYVRQKDVLHGHGQPWGACVMPMMEGLQFEISDGRHVVEVSKLSDQRSKLGRQYVLLVKCKEQKNNSLFECELSSSGDYIGGRAVQW